jgi:FKBP-type peptidyl-prolyl cis-trans isomerase
VTKRRQKSSKKRQDRTLLITGGIVAIAVIAVMLLVLTGNNPPANQASSSGSAGDCNTLVRLYNEGGMTTTASGLQYKVLAQGDGPQPVASSTVTAHYRGCLLNGTQFDSSYDRGQPSSFPLSGVIRGWTEGLQLMPTGSHYLFYIPSELGYAAQGRAPSIPPNTPLLFEVELLGFQ